MIMQIYSVRDSKAELYNTPFYGNTHAEAERSFRTAVNDPQTSLNKFPEDFDLWYHGTFDTVTGQIKALQSPQHMLKAIACIKAERPSASIAEVTQLHQ